jgi:hypothetical protein
MSLEVKQRRMQPPWRPDESDGCFIVWNTGGQALAYVYFEVVLDRRAAASLLTKDEARQLATNFAKLPDLLTQ